MRAAFGRPGFKLLFSGLVASMLGDSLMLIVLAIWVKELTGSSGAAGLTFFFLAAPALIAPVFGLLIDRLKRRTVLIWGNVASAVAMMPLLLVHDSADVWIIYVVAVLYGLSFVIMPAALNGLLKELVPEELLAEANASLATTREGLRLVGPLAGAGLYTAVGGGAVAMIDAASFLAAAAAVALLAVHETVPEQHGGHWRVEFLAGIRHVWSDQVLKHTVIGVGVALLVVGFMESAVFAMVQAFDKPPSYVGVIVSVQGVGAIAGGLSSAWLIKRLGEVAAIWGSLAVFSLALAVCAASPLLPVVFGGVVMLGYALPVFIVAFTTLLQRRTPGRLMGRVSTAADVVLGTPQAISIAMGALLVTVLTYRDIYWICAVVIAAAAVYIRVALRERRSVAVVSAAGGGDGTELGEHLPQVEPCRLD